MIEEAFYKINGLRSSKYQGHKSQGNQRNCFTVGETKEIGQLDVTHDSELDIFYQRYN